MLPRSYRNLVSASSLTQELEEYLRVRADEAPLEEVCREILLVPPLNRELAAHLVAGLVAEDMRFEIHDGALRFQSESAEEAWARRKHFAVVDVETTMGGPHSVRIIEIAVCTLANGAPRVWSSLVNPGCAIAPWVSQLTGIRNDMVRTAPRFAEVAEEILNRLEDAIVVAHHARFDVASLNSELGRAFGKRLANRYLCTVELARRFLAGPENYRLETVSRYLRLKHERPHRAWSDAETAALLFRELEARAGDQMIRFLRPRPPLRPLARRASAGTLAQDR